VLQHARAHELGVCGCDCCIYVHSLLQSVAALPNVSSVQLTELRSIGGLNKGTVCKEDTFRGLVRVSVRYAFAADQLLDPAEAQKKTSALAGKILECFDGTMVRCSGGGWKSGGSDEKVYRFNWVCRTNEANKSTAGKRKEKGWRKERAVAGGVADPCCANVRLSPCCSICVVSFSCLACLDRASLLSGIHADHDRHSPQLDFRKNRSQNCSAAWTLDFAWSDG